MSISRRRANRRQALLGMAALGLPQVRALAVTRSTPSGLAMRPLRVPLALADAVELSAPSAVRLGGWLGGRVALNAGKRLLDVDTEPLLAGFRHKPGSHPWIGEHVGKWLHAAALAWANNGDPALRAKLDRVAGELMAAQEPDGYLGTYVQGQRFGLYDGADWDVWSHKYGLIGLLTYHQYTGNEQALHVCRKSADLLLGTFPAERSILAAGTHLGMAATSVLEPIVLLYRLTGDARYLAFARYLVKSWDEDKGAGIVKTLLAQKRVDKVANAKAYEMLSNLVGLCELARVTGDRQLVDAVLIAWQDIVDHRLYVTGTTSQWEHFQTDHDMRGDVRAHVGETCVTTTWIQLNLALLQLTGQARFGDELERSLYNHLTAAQHPRGDDWCYYTALEGRKQYDKGITCCHSSGPRGLALAPQAAYLCHHAMGHDTLLVNTFEPSQATLLLGGRRVTIIQDSGFPYRGETRLVLRLTGPATFAVKLRVPAWARPLTLAGATEQDGWAVLPRRSWKDGDVISVAFTLGSRVKTGEHTLAGRAALSWGPFVLACDNNDNPALPGAHLLTLVGAAAVGAPRSGQQLSFRAEVLARPQARVQAAIFRTYADAGADHGLYRVWLRAPGLDAPGPGESLLVDGQQSSSRGAAAAGAGDGSIIDEDFESLVTTATGKPADQDWFAVTLQRPVTARRFVFTHGKSFHDGGWFDTRTGKPRVQIRRDAEAAWETVGKLDGYPATTAASAQGVEQWFRDAQFSLVLEAPISFTAVRVIGVPASGDDPRQAFASCSELQAFSR
ncbi:MAG: glycoside hydrolase family 127 protein [Vitreoscilla sp.]|nr:glycoside hydrolase family 127 protein [Vitreoscilla sp.]